MINFIIGTFVGCIIGVIAFAICIAGGRADLELKIFNLELENKAATNKIEELMGLQEITPLKLTEEQEVQIAKKIKDWTKEMAMKRKILGEK